MIIWDKKVKFLTLCLALIVSSAGCDFFKSLTGSSEKKDKKMAEEVTSSAPQKAAPLAKDVLARVGSWTITKNEFSDRLSALKEVVPEYDVDNPEAKKLVLEELVRQQLLVDDAEKSGLANSKDITAAVEEFRRTLIVREVARELTEKIEVTDEEARAFYDEKKDVLIDSVQWRVGEIVVNDSDKAKGLLAKILGGAAFEDIAKANSIGETADQGGDLGFINDVEFPEMGSALLTLEEGGVSSVVKGPKGYYIFKLIEKKGGAQIPFEDIKQDIVQNRLLFKQQQAILDYIEKLKQRITVDINEELL